MQQQLTLPTERWRPIPGYESNYMASDRGRVKSLPRTTNGRPVKGCVLKGSPDIEGYPAANLWKDGISRTFRIHTLVLLAFVGPCPPWLECRHRDGSRTNSRLDNISWSTVSKNQMDRVEHGTSNRGTANGCHKLTPDEVREIRAASGIYREIGDAYGVSMSTVSLIKRRERWAWLD